jgi:murein DD-endopeptidase MepM/ murein hydrolase activator NlpD
MSYSMSRHIPLFLLLLLGLVASGCTTGQIGERVSGELLLSEVRGEKLALLRNPTGAGLLSSRYGYRRHPITGMNKPHRGIDLAAPRGAPVFAAADGVLLFQGVGGTYGNLSRIKHGTSVVTAYAHLDRFELGLTPGMRIEKGQVIGYIGTTGRSSGPHLHYEVLVHGEHVDPLTSGGIRFARGPGDGFGVPATGSSGLVRKVAVR